MQTGNIKVIGRISKCAAYGLSKLQDTLLDNACRLNVTAGTLCASDEIKAITENAGIDIDINGSYGLFYTSPDELFISGYDDTGLMYGCFDVLDHINEGNEIVKTVSIPHTKIRGIFTFLHNRDLEDWFYEESYWDYLFSSLAQRRFNSFNLIFSHQTYYLTPMFAYFLPESSHSDIYPLDVSEKEIKRNYDMLQFISKLAHDRGIDFIIGIWQVTTWKKSKWFEPQKAMVCGLTDENLPGYTYSSVKRLISEFPYIKGFQLRVNGEAGIERSEQTSFFTNTFFKAINESSRPVLLDFRGWLAEPDCFENAISMCPDMRLSVKYWDEFMGAPYQPAKIRPR